MYKLVEGERTNFEAETKALLDSTPLPKDIIDYHIRPFFKEEVPLIMPEEMPSLEGMSKKFHELMKNFPGDEDTKYLAVLQAFDKITKNREYMFMRIRDLSCDRIHKDRYGIVSTLLGIRGYRCDIWTNTIVAIYKRNSTINRETLRDQLLKIRDEQEFILKNRS